MNYGKYYYNLNKARLADGQEYLFSDEDKYSLQAERDIHDEDWKTALVHGNPCIPKGSEVELIRIAYNLYGKYLVVRYQGYFFYAKPSYFTYVGKKAV